jgi:Family of unknown function (DUF6953)
MAAEADVAQWMLDKVMQEGSLSQSDAVYHIEQEFGPEFVYENDNGNPAISPKVLSIWRQISKDKAEWVNRGKIWYRT